MTNLLRMDLRRLFRGGLLYILIGVLTAVVASVVFLSDSSADLTTLLGAAPTSGFNMFLMGPGMGMSAIYMMLGIIAMSFICNDYANGFAKNIFSAHTRKWNYFVSKYLTILVASGIFMILFVLETVIIGAIAGRSMTVDSVPGIIGFIFQKWLISSAFAAVYILINLLTRSKAVGAVMAFLLGTGGIVMGISIFLGMAGIDGSIITEFTIFGSSELITADFDLLVSLRVLATCAVWTVIYAALSSRVLKTKDVV